MHLHLLLFVGCLCFSTVLKVSCQNGTEIQRTFELLEEGRKLIQITNNTNVVLVMGVSGAGKSTFSQWIAGEDDKLISVETRPGSGKYLIRDENNKIGLSTVSKTLFPELHTDEATETTFYDFPGFSDTRNPSYDIAASYFIKHVLERVRNVKIIFLTSFYSVEMGADRFVFPGLLKNINELIKNIDKFRDSIALVVSKVDNIHTEDSSIIEDIASCLEEFNKDFRNDLKRSDISVKKRKFIVNAMKIIKIFLTKENGEYSRIKLFRKPNAQGPLSENEILTDEKLAVQKLLSGNLRHTSIKHNDFGFTISDDSKLEIINLAAVINDQITDSINQIATTVKKHLTSFVEPVRGKIDVENLGTLSLLETLILGLDLKKQVNY